MGNSFWAFLLSRRRRCRHHRRSGLVADSSCGKVVLDVDKEEEKDWHDGGNAIDDCEEESVEAERKEA